MQKMVGNFQRHKTHQISVALTFKITYNCRFTSDDNVIYIL